MQDNIGKVAGAIWHYLSINGEATLTKLRRDIDGTESQVMMGIGWLAREGKLNFKKRRRATYIMLRKSEQEGR